VTGSQLFQTTKVTKFTEKKSRCLPHFKVVPSAALSWRSLWQVSRYKKIKPHAKTQSRKAPAKSSLRHRCGSASLREALFWFPGHGLNLPTLKGLIRNGVPIKNPETSSLRMRTETELKLVLFVRSGVHHEMFGVDPFGETPFRRWDNLSCPSYARKTLFFNFDKAQNGQVILSNLLRTPPLAS